jgi:hypothetical protein
MAGIPVNWPDDESIVCPIAHHTSYLCPPAVIPPPQAAENRNYLAARMTEEVGEIIRVLQLVTYDEEEWSSDNIQVSGQLWPADSAALCR